MKPVRHLFQAAGIMASVRESEAATWQCDHAPGGIDGLNTLAQEESKGGGDVHGCFDLEGGILH